MRGSSPRMTRQDMSHSISLLPIRLTAHFDASRPRRGRRDARRPADQHEGARGASAICRMSRTVHPIRRARRNGLREQDGTERFRIYHDAACSRPAGHPDRRGRRGVMRTKRGGASRAPTAHPQTECRCPGKTRAAVADRKHQETGTPNHQSSIINACVADAAKRWADQRALDDIEHTPTPARSGRPCASFRHSERSRREPTRSGETRRARDCEKGDRCQARGCVGSDNSSSDHKGIWSGRKIPAASRLATPPATREGVGPVGRKSSKPRSKTARADPTSPAMTHECRPEK